ncbi:MAG: N-acetyltransferase [Sphingomonadaceae bacterium]
MSGLVVRPVEGRADLKRFVGFGYDIYRGDPHAALPLRREQFELLDPARNPWFEHARARLFLAERDGRVVGRISAQVDELVQVHMGAGTGQFGFFAVEDDPAVSAALFDAAEDWLRAQGMTRSMGPFSLSIWDEPGLLIEGFDHPPTVMMGHARPWWRTHVEARGYAKAKDLYTYDLKIDTPFPPAAQRVVRTGEGHKRLVVRETRMADYDREAATILDILNDAWSGNWGFIPLTPAEALYAGKKLRPIVRPDLVRIAEYDGEPIAFMFTLPDLNEVTRGWDGRLFPFHWVRLLLALRRPRPTTMRVPLMGVRRKFQGTRVASLAAFMMIEYIRRASVANYGATRGEIGWILEDNGPMRTIAEAIESRINKVYRIYERPL